LAWIQASKLAWHH